MGVKRHGGASIRTVHGNPLHDVDVLRENDDGLEVPLDKGCLDEWAAEIEWLGGIWAQWRGWGRHFCGCGCWRTLGCTGVARHGPPGTF